jgi:CRISPR-associated protein Cmr4
MIDASEVFFYWTESPLHAGVGSSTGVVDQPIQRDVATRFPIVHFSTIKGALRDHYSERCGMDRARTNAIFGPDEAASEYAAALSMSDARILLFPVRSLRGTLAWVTSPLALAYLWRDLDRCGIGSFPGLPDREPEEGHAWVTSNCPLSVTEGNEKPEIVLEEYSFFAHEEACVQSLARWIVESASAIPGSTPYGFWKRRIFAGGASHVAILNDDDFRAFVELSTDVVHRNRINDDTGVVEDGHLWTEENLPSDCLLYSVAHSSAPRAVAKVAGLGSASDVLNEVSRVLAQYPLLQIGGNATVGRGLTRMTRIAREKQEDGNVAQENA